MLYMTMKDGDEWCVRKKGPDGKPMGDSMGCHASEEEANKQMAALHANVQEYDNSFNDHIERVRTAFEKQFNPLNLVQSGMLSPWVTDIFEDKVTVRVGEEMYFVPMTKTGDAITFVPRDQWQKVKLSYVTELEQDNAEPYVLREFQVHEFKGKYPEIETYPFVDKELLYKGDAEPFHIVLPIAEVGRVSANKLEYDEELVAEIENQLPGLGGIRGHTPDEKRDTAFPTEDVDWIGHKRVGKTLWAKAYVPPGSNREEVRRRKARGGKIGTSIYGAAKRENTPAGNWRARGMRLEQVDLAPISRASLKLGGDFAITAEMEGAAPAAGTVTELDNHEDDMEKTQIIAELTVTDLSDALRNAVIAEYESTKIAELEAEKTQKEQRISELEIAVNAKDVRIAELEGVTFETDLDAKIAELTDWQVNTEEGKDTLAKLRDEIKARATGKLGTVREMAQAETTVKELIEGDLKWLMELTRNALAGKAMIVSAKQSETVKTPTAEEIAASRAQTGI